MQARLATRGGFLAILMLAAQVAAAQTITFYTSRTARVQKSADGQPLVRNHDFVVTAQPEAVKVKKQVKGDITTYATADLRVTVNSATGQVAFADGITQKPDVIGLYLFDLLFESQRCGQIPVEIC